MAKILIWCIVKSVRLNESVRLPIKPCAGWDINLMLPKVVKQNMAHELFMNVCVVVVAQRYYYIDIILASSLDFRFCDY